MFRFFFALYPYLRASQAALPSAVGLAVVTVRDAAVGDRGPVREGPQRRFQHLRHVPRPRGLPVRGGGAGSRGAGGRREAAVASVEHMGRRTVGTSISSFP